MSRSRTRRCAPILAALMVAALGATAAAQDEPQPTTISAIEAGEVAGQVSLVGAALVQTDDDEYGFSDGTGVIEIDVDTSTADPNIPLFTLITIEGTVASDEIDVTSWAPLDIMTPAVIVPEEQVIEAFHGWIIAYGSQAPAE